MSRVRNLTDLLEPTGDVKLDHLDNTVSVTVTDNLISTSAIEALSANQGKELKTLVDDLESASDLDGGTASTTYSIADITLESGGAT